MVLRVNGNDMPNDVWHIASTQKMVELFRLLLLYEFCCS